MATIKRERLRNGMKRETTTYDNGAQKRVVYKDGLLWRDVKSVERRPKKK